MKQLLGLLLACVLSGLSWASEPSKVEPAQLQVLKAGEPRNWDFSIFESVPIQAGGRVKPLDTYLREMVLFTTGRRSFEGWSTTDMILSWMISPEMWREVPFIRVGRPDVRTQLVLEVGRSSFSPRELLRNPALLQYADVLSGEGKTAKSPVTAQSKRDPRDEELKAVVNRISLFRQTIAAEAWTLLPSPRVEDPWRPLTQAQNSEEQGIASAFADVIRAYAAADEPMFQRAAQSLSEMVLKQSRASGIEISERDLKVERFYNRLRPFFLSFLIYLLATVLLGVASMTANKGKERGTTQMSTWTLAGLGVAVLGFVVHTGGLVLRVLISGRPPVTNMYESVIWVAYGALFFGFIVYALQRHVIALASATGVAALTIFAADAAPAVLDPGIHPLVPVLRSNFWLTIHVLTITLGYAAFALTFAISVVTLFQYLTRALDEKGFSDRIQGLNHLSYRATQFGVVLLAAGTILGGIWADYSWGRVWGWDPKETWALIALLAYVAILHGRFAGWVGTFGFPAWNVVCFLTVVMAWYGVNYVLGAGLHSYGFGGGGLAYVASGCALTLVYVIAVYGVFRFKASKLKK